MMIVSTSGYIISVLGPYLADSKNSDAKILNHMIQTNVEDIRKWVEEDDIFIVDRGFRDAEALLDDLGIHVEMPSFLTRHPKQHTTEEANTTRCVTKVLVNMICHNVLLIYSVYVVTGPFFHRIFFCSTIYMLV